MIKTGKIVNYLSVIYGNINRVDIFWEIRNDLQKKVRTAELKTP